MAEDSNDSPETATITTVVKPSNRYQMTVTEGVRQMLEFDGEAAAVEVDIKVKRVIDPDEIE